MTSAGQDPDPLPPEGPAAIKTSSRRPLRWVLLGLFVVAIAGYFGLGLNSYLSLATVREHLDEWKGQVVEHLLLSLLFFFVVYVVVTALSLPIASLLTVLAGALFDRWLGTAVVSVASTLGATLAFLGSRYVFRDAVQSRHGPRLAALNRGLEKDGAYYLLILRLVPYVPFFVINLGMGLTPMRVATYVLVSWIGMLPGTFLYVNVGTELGSLKSLKGLVSPTVWIALGLLGVVPLAIRKLVQWRKGSEPEPPRTEA